ncbi:fibronectin-like isoform X2 [Denticeps clupeoides]|uniref:fibronectin-like isoform X2 n=1 Tax=Denticeps clupeoides TaxID=299321 RepID=UPI0010A3F297|nr:fibronectin-like isoform X2 [Denticeps clupeoides]
MFHTATGWGTSNRPSQHGRADFPVSLDGNQPKMDGDVRGIAGSQQGKPGSPVPSVLSMKSDKSQEEPPNMTGDLSGITDCSSDCGAAAVLCGFCSSYCPLHVRQHYMSPALQRHRLVEVTGDVEQRLCQQHHRQMEFYCNTDHQPVCALCSMVEHNGHEIIIIQPGQGHQNLHTELPVNREVPPPEDLELERHLASASLTWNEPPDVEHVSYLLTVWCKGNHVKNYSITSLQFSLNGLHFDEEYTVTLSTVLSSGHQSRPVVQMIQKWQGLPPPGQIQVTSVSSDSVSLSWGAPEGLVGLAGDQRFRMSWEQGGKQYHLDVLGLNAEIHGLDPGQEYEFRVCTWSNDGKQSPNVSASVCTALPPPGQIIFTSVRPDSVSLSWGAPEGWTRNLSFKLTWNQDGDQKCIMNAAHRVTIDGLRPGKEYEFSVAALSDVGSQSRSVTASVCTVIPPPECLSVTKGTTSASVTWSKPEGVDQASYLLSLRSDGEEEEIFYTDHLRYSLSGLKPATEYTIGVHTVLSSGHKSRTLTRPFCTRVPAPEKVTVVSVSATSAKISWIPPHGMDQIPHSFLISYWSKGSKTESISTDSSRTELTELKPDTPYTLTVWTEVKHGGRSQETSTNIHTALPVPEELTVVSVSTTSCKLRWILSHGWMKSPYCFLISYCSDGSLEKSFFTDSWSTEITNLNPGTEYTITVSTEKKYPPHRSGRMMPAPHTHTHPNLILMLF